MSPVTKVLITGANVGLGFDCARQLALVEGVEKVILGCRNPTKAQAAKEKLEELTGKKDVFEVLVVDVSNLESVRKAVSELKEPIDGLVLNAGGPGGEDPGEITEYGVPAIFAVNVLGSVLMVDLLLEQKKLTGSVVYVSTEAARGVPEMGFQVPTLETGSVEEMTSVCDGSFFKDYDDAFRAMYGHVKLLGSLWISSMARKVPTVRFLSVSPGGTTGTAFASDMPRIQRIIFTFIMPLMQFFGKMHSLEVGAKRYVDVLVEDDTYKSGVFYASRKGMSGEMADQVEHIDILGKEDYQDNASIAIHKFLK